MAPKFLKVPAAASQSRNTKAAQKLGRHSCNGRTKKTLATKYAEALTDGLSDILIAHGHPTPLLTDKLRDYYDWKFQSIPEVELPTAIKQSLALFFSKRMEQSELPEVGPFCFDLFPNCVMRWVRARTKHPNLKKRRVYKHRLLFSILSVKRVMPSVSNSFIRKAYEKHGVLLGTEGITPQNILEEGRKLGEFYGRKANRLYNPYQAPLPSHSACYEKKKSEGGCWNLIKEKANEPYSFIRSEPTVLLLRGKPGCGKSRLVNSIVGRICRREQMDISKSVYTRNCSTKHWDGYEGQPITVLDDWSQSFDLNTDIQELIALVTDNQYVLPMAELGNKGTTFTSKFLIVCTNRFRPGYVEPKACSLNTTELIDYRAMFRRFNFAFNIVSALDNSVVYEDWSSVFRTLGNEPDDFVDTLVKFAEITSPTLGVKGLKKSILRNDFIDRISDDMRDSFLTHCSSIQQDLPEGFGKYKWYQNLYDFRFSCYLDGSRKFDGERHRDYLTYPLFPDDSILPKVMTCAVNNKPLSVRMITKGSFEGRVLKPLQQALWKALKQDDQFFCIGDPSVEEAFRRNLQRGLRGNEFYLSGDYDASTDRLHLDLSLAILEGILSQIGHEPTKRWARYEFGKHIIEYPSWTGIPPVEQKRGQLMGNLLSFPILCIANMALCNVSGIHDKMINGDDLGAIVTMEQYELWKKNGASCGLLPSIGKNYLSKTFLTFNSKLLLNGQEINFVQPGLMRREGKSINRCFEDALKTVHPSLLVFRNKRFLRKTMRSLDVPVSHGGLGTSWRKIDPVWERNARLCYLYMIEKKKPCISVSNSLLPKHFVWGRIPVLGQKENPDIDAIHPIEISMEKALSWRSDLKEVEYNEIQCSFGQIKSFERKILKSQILREFVNSGDLRSCPALSEIVKQSKPIWKTRLHDYEDKGLASFIILNQRANASAQVPERTPVEILEEKWRDYELSLTDSEKTLFLEDLRNKAVDGAFRQSLESFNR